MEATGTSKTLVPLYQTTRDHIPEDNNLHGKNVLVNMIMNLLFHTTQGILSVAEQLLASQEGIYSMQLVMVS
jgi:hypothetical protein